MLVEQRVEEYKLKVGLLGIDPVLKRRDERGVREKIKRGKKKKIFVYPSFTTFLFDLMLSSLGLLMCLSSLALKEN